ncbi:hypothetical protein [Alteribacter populi]|nr:hypothetical protein [Alteribacter populi]
MNEHWSELEALLAQKDNNLTEKGKRRLYNLLVDWVHSLDSKSNEDGWA